MYYLSILCYTKMQIMLVLSPPKDFIRNWFLNNKTTSFNLLIIMYFFAILRLLPSYYHRHILVHTIYVVINVIKFQHNLSCLERLLLARLNSRAEATTPTLFPHDLLSLSRIDSATTGTSFITSRLQQQRVGIYSAHGHMLLNYLICLHFLLLALSGPYDHLTKGIELSKLSNVRRSGCSLCVTRRLFGSVCDISAYDSFHLFLIISVIIVTMTFFFIRTRLNIN